MLNYFLVNISGFFFGNCLGEFSDELLPWILFTRGLCLPFSIVPLCLRLGASASSSGGDWSSEVFSSKSKKLNLCVCVCCIYVILGFLKRGPVTFPPLVGPCFQRLGSPKNYHSKKLAPPLKTKKSNHHVSHQTLHDPTNGLSIFLAQKTSS